MAAPVCRRIALIPVLVAGWLGAGSALGSPNALEQLGRSREIVRDAGTGTAKHDAVRTDAVHQLVAHAR